MRPSRRERIAPCSTGFLLYLRWLTLAIPRPPAMRLRLPFPFRALLIAAALAIPMACPIVADARPAPDSFADLANRLLPTVVNIATSQTLKAGPQVGLNLPPDSPFSDLFKDFLGQQNVPRHVTSLGSGFIIDGAGYIVT